MGALAVVLSLAMAVAPLAKAAIADEMRVQAAYLLNFIRYSRWPEPSTGPLTVAVLGTSTNAAILRDAALRAGPINGRAIVVRHLPLASIAPARAEATDALRASVGTAQVVYVGPTHHGWSRAVAAAAAGKPVLTVGAGQNFLREGGMIELYLQRGTLRFDVNAPVIRASPIEVSARLLLLARPAGGD